MTTSPVPSITDELLAELKQKAKAADAGDWIAAPAEDEAHRWEVMLGSFYIATTHDWVRSARSAEANAEHISASSPATILALVEHIRSLNERLEKAEKDAARYRWLAARASTADTGGTAWDFPWIDAWDYKPGSALNEKYPDIHEAIDAAIAQEGHSHE